MVYYADPVPSKGLTRSLSECLSFATFQIRPDPILPAFSKRHLEDDLDSTLNSSTVSSTFMPSRKAVVVRGTTAFGVFGPRCGNKTQSGMSHSSILFTMTPNQSGTLTIRNVPGLWPKDSQGDQEEV